MKKEILDDIDMFASHPFFGKNEKIIWEGQPHFKSEFSKLFFGGNIFLSIVVSIFGLVLSVYFSLIFFIPLLMFFLVSNLFIKFILTLIILVILIILSPWFLSFIKRKKIRYLITDQQVILQLWSIGKKATYGIPFSEIKNIVTQKEGKNCGVIYLLVKNPQLINFNTHDLRSGERRHQPTLEMIENMEEVGRYIKLGIQKQL